MTRRTVLAGSAIALVLIAGGAGLGWKYVSDSRAADAAAAASLQSLATAWTAHKVDTVRFTDATAAASFATTFPSLMQAPVTVTVGDIKRDGDTASGTLAVAWTLPGDVKWAYDVPVHTTKSANTWQISTPSSGSMWVPGVAAGTAVQVQREWGTRGDLLDVAGKSLMPEGTVYPVQIDPARATAASVAALEKVVGEPAGSLVAKLTAAQKAGSKAPIPVITYRESDFASRRATLDAITGVIYPATSQPLASSRTFGQPLLGSFGEVTAEIVTASKGFYVAGDRAGLSGLQGQYDRQLAGTPGITVKAGDKVLMTKPAVDGADVQTSINPTIQAAAEAALAGTGAVPSAIVTIDIPTGNVSAVANSPALGYNRALTGQYPPGSTMKIITTYALLQAGLVTPETQVACPQTFTVDGRSFTNFEGETLGNPTFAEDFAHSCNTAFIALAEKLDDAALNKAAAALGLGADWASTVGVTGAFNGTIPTNNGETDKVAAAIGQGRNLASPLAMATVAANIARGSSIAPAIVQTSSTPRPATPLDPAISKTIQTLMRRVVTGGTGSALASVSGGPVSGKTGTAEYGTEVPPKNRVWFVGSQGNTAFAVMVEDGVSGGTVAAPIAADFLTALAK